MGDSRESSLAALKLQHYLQELERSLLEIQAAFDTQDFDRAVNACVVVRTRLACLDFLVDQLSPDLDPNWTQLIAEARRWVDRVPLQIRGLDRLERWLRRFGPRDLR